ncbi:MAG: hypothetical protein KKH28_11190 [Elusimicrobia bacterium]|nr:hypothetical protein [Elusimicrobiota bacterium]
MNKLKLKTIGLLAFAVLSGCATIGSLGPGSGQTFEVTGKSYNEIWKAAVTVITRSLTIVENDKAGGNLKAEAKAGMMTRGEVVGVFIRPTSANASRYTVEVLSLKRSQMQITGQNWEPTMIAGIKAELDIE